MVDVNLAEAKAQLSALVKRAESGEAVRIIRRGKPVALITAAPPVKKPIDVEKLQAFAARMPLQSESAGDFMRRMRDDERY
jgi:prevent-host-death family protein